MTRVLAIAIVTVSIVLLAKLVVAQHDVNTLRATIDADLPDNMEGEISPADVRGVLTDMLDVFPSITTVRGEIAPWARFSSVGTIADNVLPSYLRLSNFQPVASWAQLLSPTGRAPLSVLPVQVSYIPTGTCADGEVWLWNSSSLACGTVSGIGGGLSQSQVDLRIAPFARFTSAGVATPARLAVTPAANEFLVVGSSGTATDWRPISESDIPSALARDSELPTTQQLLTLNQRTILGRFPTSACPAGQILKSGGTTYSCQVDSSPASWASATSPTGVAPANRLALSPTNGEFLVATSSTTSNWRSVRDTDIPDSLARDAEIETWAIQATTGAGAIVPATVIDRALTRDADLPSALLGTALQGQTVGHCFQRVAGTDGTLSQTRLLFGFAACGGGGSSTGFATLLGSGTISSDPETFSSITLPTTGWFYIVASTEQSGINYYDSTIIEASNLTTTRSVALVVQRAARFSTVLLFSRTATNTLQVSTSIGISFSIYTLN